MKLNRKYDTQCPWLSKTGRFGGREVNPAVGGEETIFCHAQPPEGSVGIRSFGIESWLS